MSDNSSSSESTPLSPADAASIFAEIESPSEVKKEPKAEAKVNAVEEGDDAIPDEIIEDGIPVEEAIDEDAPKFTVKVDGKDVELTEAEIAEAYKNGLRQSDYTKKTMEAAALRKTADAELNQARQERTNYAQKLTEQTLILQNALESQNQINWQQLLDNDPVEYLKQQHLFQTRQSALQNAYQERQIIDQQLQQEQANNVHRFVAEQQEELLAKLPAWKDEAKAKAEKGAIRDYLKTSGFDDSEIGKVADHRSVLLARKAMLYDQMITKAKAAAKLVTKAPQRVERPGSGISQPDGRSAAMQRLSKSGSVNDAAAAFASIL